MFSFPRVITLSDWVAAASRPQAFSDSVISLQDEDGEEGGLLPAVDLGHSCAAVTRRVTKLLRAREGLEFICEFQASVELERVSHPRNWHIGKASEQWEMHYRFPPFCWVMFALLGGDWCISGGLACVTWGRSVPCWTETPLFLKPSPWFQVFHMFTRLLIPLSSMHVLIMQYMKLVQWNIHII